MQRQVKELTHNWHQSPSGEEYRRLVVDGLNIKSIEEFESISGFTYLVTYGNNIQSRVFNPNFVLYADDTVQCKQ